MVDNDLKSLLVVVQFLSGVVSECTVGRVSVRLTGIPSVVDRPSREVDRKPTIDVSDRSRR